MSVHLVGRHYSLVPEGALKSLLETPERARGRAGRRRARLARLVWIPPGLRAATTSGSSALRTAAPDGSAHAAERRPARDAARGPEDAHRRVAEAPRGRRRRDSDRRRGARLAAVPDLRPARRDAVAPWPTSSSSAASRCCIRSSTATRPRCASTTRRTCASATAVADLLRRADESWLRRKLRELQKSAGQGRTKPKPMVGDLPRAAADAGEGAVPHPRGARPAAVGRPVADAAAARSSLA